MPQNNIFVNPPSLPLLCEISGALHLRHGCHSRLTAMLILCFIDKLLFKELDTRNSFYCELNGIACSSMAITYDALCY